MQASPYAFSNKFHAFIIIAFGRKVKTFRHFYGFFIKKGVLELSHSKKGKSMVY